MESEPRTVLTIPVQLDEEFLDFLRSRMTDDGIQLLTDLAAKDICPYSPASIVLTFSNASVVKGLPFRASWAEKIIEAEDLRDMMGVRVPV